MDWRKTSLPRARRHAGGHLRIARAVCAALALIGMMGGCSTGWVRAGLNKVPLVGRFIADEREQPPPSQIQSELMHYADAYTATAIYVADHMAEVARTPQERRDAKSWKLWQATAATVTAASPNPIAGVMDMAALATVSRSALEQIWLPEFQGEATADILRRYRVLEADAWDVAGSILDRGQVDELRQLIAEWQAAHPDLREVRFVHIRDMAAQLGLTTTERITSQPDSIFQLLYLDPLAGLDPAAREIEQLRYQADRAMYQLQRMPMLMSWQTEVLVERIAATPHVKTVLEAVTRLSESAERVSQTAEQLPDWIATERQALLKDLEEGEAHLTALLTEARLTADSIETMATSVGAATTSLHEFTRQFTEEHPADQAPERMEEEPRRPFDVTEYGRSAEQIGQAARDLEGLFESFDTRTSQLKAAMAEGHDYGMEVVDHAFSRLLLLVVALTAGVVVVMVAYRLLFRGQR